MVFFPIRTAPASSRVRTVGAVSSGDRKSGAVTCRCHAGDVDVVFDRKSEPKQRERLAGICPQLQGIRAVYGILFPHERGEYSISRSLPCAPATFHNERARLYTEADRIAH